VIYANVLTTLGMNKKTHFSTKLLIRTQYFCIDIALVVNDLMLNGGIHADVKWR